jgi:hypothetical protein
MVNDYWFARQLHIIDKLCMDGVIASNDAILLNDGMREIGIDGENLMFVPPKNPQKIADKILLLLRNRRVF